VILGVAQRLTHLGSRLGIGQNGVAELVAEHVALGERAPAARPAAAPGRRRPIHILLGDGGGRLGVVDPEEIVEDLARFRFAEFGLEGVEDAQVADFAAAARSEARGHHHANGDGILHLPGRGPDARLAETFRQGVFGHRLFDIGVDAVAVGLEDEPFLGLQGRGHGAQFGSGVPMEAHLAVAGKGLAALDLGQLPLRVAPVLLKLPQPVLGHRVAVPVEEAPRRRGEHVRNAVAVPQDGHLVVVHPQDRFRRRALLCRGRSCQRQAHQQPEAATKRDR
jgi:hypothetical protein